MPCKPVSASLLFPAWAGVILKEMDEVREGVTFPRMGGGDPLAHARKPYLRYFSPHGRG